MRDRLELVFHRDPTTGPATAMHLQGRLPIFSLDDFFDVSRPHSHHSNKSIIIDVLSKKYQRQRLFLVDRDTDIRNS
jgi:hypothetical protein